MTTFFRLGVGDGNALVNLENVTFIRAIEYPDAHAAKWVIMVEFVRTSDIAMVIEFESREKLLAAFDDLCRAIQGSF